jgi:hypothetical protein
VYCLSTANRLKKALVILSEGDLEEKQALILEDKAPSLIKSRLIRFKGTHDKLMTIVEIEVFVKYYTLACKHIEVYTLPDTTNISSRRNLVC